MTLVHRRERHMYVALWFYIATIVTVTVLHVFNNLVLPLSLFKSYSLYAGVQDAFMQWWYGHNAVAFFLTTPFLGLMYYFLPKAANRPVFSYKLSIIHFWSLVFIYIWAGPHHLHYTALPEWASSLGMLFSLMLWMPSWGGMINGLLTLRGAWHKVATDPVLKFFVVGVTFYGMSTFEGPMLSIKSVNGLSHYTDWTIAHVHSGALGWNGMMTFGMIYWMLPRLFQTKLWSEKLASLHFWIATIGILLYIVPIYAAGLTQGLMWREMDAAGQPGQPRVHRIGDRGQGDVVAACSGRSPVCQRRRPDGGQLCDDLDDSAGQVRGARLSGPEAVASCSPPIRRAGVSELEDAPVLNAAKWLDVWSPDELAPSLGTIAHSIHGLDHFGGDRRESFRDRADVLDSQQRADDRHRQALHALGAWPGVTSMSRKAVTTVTPK